MQFKLLPFHFKKWGYLSILAGLIFGWIYSNSSIRIESPVFAVWSSFLEQKFFVISRTNLTDELALFFLLSGLFTIIFSKDKDENESTKKIRYKAFLLSFLLNYILLLFSILFVFGSGFIYFVVFNLISQSTIFVVCFELLKLFNRRKEKS